MERSSFHPPRYGHTWAIGEYEQDNCWVNLVSVNFLSIFISISVLFMMCDFERSSTSIYDLPKTF